MAESGRPTNTGSAGGTAINPDLTRLAHEAPKKVQLSASYTRNCPPGYPSAPDFTGCAASKLDTKAQTLANGTIVTLLGPEADALIAAGKASLHS